MKRIFVACLFGLFSSACSKKTPAPEAEVSPTPAQAVSTPSESKSGRDRALAILRKQRTEDAAWSVAVLADTDPEVVPALLEMLRDKTTAGLGRRLPEAYSSVREAAAASLAMGEPGEAAIKKQGLAILREGLKDPTPAIREHTAPHAGHTQRFRPTRSGRRLQALHGPGRKSSRRSLDALQRIGVPDGMAMIRLLDHPEPDVRRLAAEAVMVLEPVPAASVDLLLKAMKAEDLTSRCRFACTATARPQGRGSDTHGGRVHSQTTWGQA